MLRVPVPGSVFITSQSSFDRKPLMTEALLSLLLLFCEKITDYAQLAKSYAVSHNARVIQTDDSFCKFIKNKKIILARKTNHRQKMSNAIVKIQSS